jgi:cellobiose phosphorylase
MAHHHGMSLAALDNLVNQYVMQDRFHRDPFVRATELLLQEKIPGRVLLAKDIEGETTPDEPEKTRNKADEYVKVMRGTDGKFPEAHILSNGTYSVMLTDTGLGYSKMGDRAVTRWREDVTLGGYGTFFYIQNINSNMVWSAAFEPYKSVPEEYKVVFSSDKVEYFRVDGSIDTHMEVVVSPEENAEVRRISLTNHSDHSRVIEVTSYFEVVISPHMADISHPSFSKLFIKTKYLDRFNSIIATRRPRTPDERPAWLVHTVSVEGETVGSVQYETDRSKFLGRDRSISNPAAMDVDHPLSNTAGAVLDPVMSLRRRVRIKPGETVRLSYITGLSDSRKNVMDIAQKYSNTPAVNRAFEMAWTRSQVESRYLNLRVEEIEVYRRMVSHILYISPLRRMWDDTIKANTKGQPGLWPFGISGDLPIVLVGIKSGDDTELLNDILKAHEYWRVKGLSVDLVILNEDEGSYIQSFHDTLRDIISSSSARDIQDRTGGVYLRQASIMTGEERLLLYTAARIVLKGDAGPISRQIRFGEEHKPIPGSAEYKTIHHLYPEIHLDTHEVLYSNGIGGFNKEGNEYIISLSGGHRTPAPWSNIVCNEKFGFLTTESGSGYTWAENSRENKLTPWSNDPVLDPPGETIYLRDEEDGTVWSITPLPVHEDDPYVIRHGFGYSAFEHSSRGLKQELTMYVPIDDSIKIFMVKITNMSGRHRHLSAVFYARPVLGVTDQTTAPYIVSDVDEKTGIFLIRNTFSSDFPGRVVFADSSVEERTFTGDRSEFIGRKGSVDMPGAMKRLDLSGRVGAGYDPCAAIKVKVELKESEEKTILFTLGQEPDVHSSLSTAYKYRDVSEAQKAFDKVRKFWDDKLGAIKVITPDASLDLLTNGWLLYQVIACRLWARSGFYQSGGAYGFRDQLQDVLSVCYVSPDMTRNQIIESSRHQFLEGDVQHWWHPVTDRGIRTRFSDDLLWLPYVTADYIGITGDYSILEVETRFLEDEPLGENEDERYNKPRISEESGSIYRHCIAAIDRSLRYGPHGIPLIGSGDWNDGLSRVGIRGAGESIWLGWFLYVILMKFAPICKDMGDEERSETYIRAAKSIVSAIEENGWDGSWYRRAYFDNGTPLGSASNNECQIDSLAQSWAAISGGARPYRVLEAMGALEQYLINRGQGTIMLLTPPFDKGDLEPGYIKGYVPGVRENGGQYTHAAIWVILAYAKMGMGDTAWELFNMINPINHSRTAMEYSRYKVEPYVMAADVYAVDPHSGRGGWTWYTGAASWMHRVCIRYMLGLKIKGDKFTISPCIPKAWSGYSIRYRYKNTVYNIEIKNPLGVNEGVKSIALDGRLVEDGMVSLLDDGREHDVEVLM